MKRNELWWADLPQPAGRRPVLLVSRDEAYEYRGKVIIAEITTKIRGRPTEVIVGPHEGLAQRSAITLENLQTVPKRWLTERIGTLDTPGIAAVDRALAFALDLHSF